MASTETSPAPTVAEAARLLRRGSVSPLELTREALERIERLDPLLASFITVTADQALEAARAAEAEIAAGRYRGPLHGIPYSAKDVYCTRGIRTTAGSRILGDFVPDRESAATERLRSAGAVLLGKTNLHEFHAGATTENPHYGTCRNPWDPERLAGGSSGGSGAAVAAGLGLFSLGTDTGGSIRIPSAFCGLVGLKPTQGLVSRYGLVPESWSCDHCGPMARTVRDCAIVLQAIAGHDPRDPASADVRLPSLERRLRGGVEGLRVGVPRAGSLGPVDSEVASAFEQAARLLESLGARVVEVEIPDATLVSDVLQVIIWSEAANYHQTWLRERGDEYGDEVRAKFEGALTHLAVEYVQAQRVRTTIARAFDELWQVVDVLASPTIPIPAPRIGEEIVLGGEIQPVERTIAKLTPYANLTGHPALSLPCGFTRGGLPIGLMLQAPPFADVRLLRAALAYEDATDWHMRCPSL